MDMRKALEHYFLTGDEVTLGEICEEFEKVKDQLLVGQCGYTDDIRGLKGECGDGENRERSEHHPVE